MTKDRKLIDEQPEERRSPGLERRRRERLNLRCEIQLMPDRGTQMIRGETLNVSSDGLYCVIGEPLPEGEAVSATLLLSPSVNLRSSAMTLDMQLIVLRTDHLTETGGYGLACSVRDYHPRRP